MGQGVHIYIYICEAKPLSGGTATRKNLTKPSWVLHLNPASISYRHERGPLKSAMV